MNVKDNIFPSFQCKLAIFSSNGSTGFIRSVTFKSVSDPIRETCIRIRSDRINPRISVDKSEIRTALMIGKATSSKHSLDSRVKGRGTKPFHSFQRLTSQYENKYTHTFFPPRIFLLLSLPAFSLIGIVFLLN